MIGPLDPKQRHHGQAASLETREMNTKILAALWTSDNVAELLCCNVETIRRRARAGLIPGTIKIGRSWRFKIGPIDEIVANGLRL